MDINDTLKQNQLTTFTKSSCMADLMLDPPPEDENIATPPSDHHDSTYSEPPPMNSIITPEQRKRFAENFSEAAKKRVEKATNHFTKLRCVISNAPELYSVEYAHILPRATGSYVVSNQRLHLRFDSHICYFSSKNWNIHGA
jgi:hypothetical protein